MTDLLVGVDIGTTLLKVGVFDLAGNLVAGAKSECAPSYLPQGRVEIAAECWWAAFESSLAECLDAVERSTIRAVAVSSQAQTYVLLDEQGKALGPAASWLDTSGDAEGCARDLAGQDYYAHTGWAEPCDMLASCKLREHDKRRDAWTGAAHLLFADGYLLYRLAGEFAVSRNLAAMSGLYSMKQRGWWPEAAASARVPPALLPEVHDVGALVGSLDASLAEQWGVAEFPVVAGANDQTAAAMGAGLSRPGEVALGLGTALAAYQVIEPAAPFLASRPLRGPYVGGLHYQLELLNTAGAVLEWARELLAPEHSWEGLFADALTVEPGCGGLRVRPDFTDNRGAIAGLDLAKGGKHIFRAALEGIACAARRMLDDLAAPDTVRLTGGGSADDGWMQMIADISGRRIERVDERQAGLRGTALLAGHGAGLFDDVLEAARSLGQRITAFTPRKEHADVYDRVYADYLELRTSKGDLPCR